MSQGPNVIYFHVHDQGRYVQPYGYAVPTPHLQRLADAGVTFRRAFCTAPSCSPSRASLLTGQYPHECGMYGLTNQGWALQDYSQHLQHRFKESGYQTVLCGSHHVTELTEAGIDRLGYDRVLQQESSSSLTEERTHAALAFLQSQQTATQPFFLALGYDITHRSKWDRSFVHSFAAHGPLQPDHCRPIASLPDSAELRLEAALQQRASLFQDDQLGLVMDCLDACGLADNTILIYTTDHGPGLPRAKLNLNDDGTGVSLVIRGPGFTGGQCIDALVSHLDIYPTCCEILGIDKPDYLQGHSLLPLASGAVNSIRDAIFAEQNYHGRYLPLRSIRTDRWRYTRRIGDQAQSEGYYTADVSFASTFLKQQGSMDRPVLAEQLYDCHFDPTERQNLATDPAYKEVISDLRQQLDAWMHNTADPAAEDAIPEPPPRPEWATAAGQNKRDWQRRWAETREHLCERLM